MKNMNQTYGRKEIRNHINVKRIFASWGVCFTIGLVVGCLMMNCFKPSKKIEGVMVTKESTFGKVEEVKISEFSFDWQNEFEEDFIQLDVPMDKELQEYIYSMCYVYNIEFPFVMGLISIESGFQPNIISNSNDYGLMQINEINHGWLSETLGVTDFLDPYENTKAGLFIFFKQIA